MNFDWTISPAVVWMLLGGLLILAEFALPGVIAVFFGLAAVLVGLVLLLGVPLSLNLQILAFGVLALFLVLVVRNRVKSWFVGSSESTKEGVEVVPVGTMVTAAKDFVDGFGIVNHRGSHWNARADEQVVYGQRLWICGRTGLVLHVSSTPPASAVR